MTRRTSASGSNSTSSTLGPSSGSGARREQLVGDVLHRGAGRRQVRAGGHAAVGEVDPLEEARDDLAQLGEHEIGVRAGLGQRMGPHAQQQRLVGLPRPVDPDVRQGRGRQDAAHGVEGLGLQRHAVHEVAVAGSLGEALAVVGEHRLGHLGVRVEHAVEVTHVAQPHRAAQDLGVAVVAVAAPEPGVVGDVAGALLEVRHEPPPLEHLGQQVRGLLAREVHAPELGDRVVAVLEEDPVVQLLGPLQAHRGVDRRVAGDVEVAHELVEEQAAQALGRARVTGEQRPLHDLGQVHEGEHRTVEVREVPPQDVGLRGGVLLADVDGHREPDRTGRGPREG